MLGNMCGERESILQIYPLFSPQSIVRQNTFLCCTVHIYSCILCFVFSTFLSFTHRKICLVLSCFHVPVPHHRNGGNSGILLPSGHSRSVAMTPFPQGFMSSCNLNHSAFKKRVFMKKAGKCVTRYLLAQIFHAVFLNHLLTKINVSLFPTVSSDWHLPQPA